MNVFYQASVLCKSTRHKHDGELVKMVQSSFLTMAIYKSNLHANWIGANMSLMLCS